MKKNDIECCCNCRRWSKQKSWHVTMAWCMKRRMSTKADAVCGYYQPCDTEGKHYNGIVE